MKAKRVWTVCLAVLTLLALLAGCGKQTQVQSDPSPEPDPEPALFDGSFAVTGSVALSAVEFEVTAV